MAESRQAILFLASWYPVEYNPTHGIFIRNHAIALSKYRKVIVVYAYCSRERPHYKIHKINVNENLTEYFIRFTKPAISIKPFSSALQFFKFKKAHKILIKEIKKSNLHICSIQVNVVFPAALALHLYKKAFNAYHTVLEHWSGYLPQDGNYTGSIMKKTTESCISSAKKIWHISDQQKEAMLNHGLKGNYELIYNVVDTDVFCPSEHKKTKIKLVHVSSLVEREKNMEGTFKAIKYLQDKGLDFDFTVIGGDKEELDEAKSLAKKLQLEKIEFTGTLKPSLVAKHMQEASALILFSHFEGMPVVALEALSCGLPVFASRVGQLTQIIKPEFGVLVDINDHTQISDALIKLFNNGYQFNPGAMREFVLQHAAYDAVGKQLSEAYK